MIINEAINHVRELEGMTSAELARKSGKSPSFVSDMYKRGDLQVTTACAMAKAMGYEIVLRKIGDHDGIVLG